MIIVSIHYIDLFLSIILKMFPDAIMNCICMPKDMNSISTNGSRIAKCMKEYFIYKKNYKGAVNSTLLAKSLYQRLWDDSPYLLKQLPGIGMVTAKVFFTRLIYC